MSGGEVGSRDFELLRLDLWICGFQFDWKCIDGHAMDMSGFYQIWRLAVLLWSYRSGFELGTLGVFWE
jgi:hypothetical protein